MELRLLRNIPKGDFLSKKVLLRADFDVSISAGKVKEDYRIKKVLPTINFLLERGEQIRILSHLGRPHGQPDLKLSLRPVAEYLEKALGQKILFIDNPLDPQALSAHKDSSDIILFENLRFWPEEEANDSAFSQKLKLWGDVYINEAFAASHRSHASITSLPGLMPSYAGLWLEQEIASLKKIIENPLRPAVAILGGAKLETKLPLIKRFLDAGDKVLLGGGVANTVFFAKGYPLGESCSEKDSQRFLHNLDLNNKNLYLPTDGVLASVAKVDGRLADVKEGTREECMLDIGPKTISLFTSLIKDAKTIFWNGPMGVTENDKFLSGTLELAKNIGETQAFKLVGGGDTIAALDQNNLLDKFDHVSTGGGAMLEFLAGQKLPGIEILKS